MNEDSKRIRILAVDDHPILRQGIAGLIADESDMTLVAEAANGREAIQQFPLKSLSSLPSMPLKTPCPRWKCASWA